MRALVSHVISALVGRADDALTAEDRNWITSVSSRQKSCVRKPTLSAILDVAFPLFSLAVRGRGARLQDWEHINAAQDPNKANDNMAKIVSIVYKRIVDCINADGSKGAIPPMSSVASFAALDRQLTMSQQKHANERALDYRGNTGCNDNLALAIDPVVSTVMNVIHHPASPGGTTNADDETIRSRSVTECLKPVANALQLALNSLTPPPSPSTIPLDVPRAPDNSFDTVDCAVGAFVHSMPPLERTANGTADAWHQDALKGWVRRALTMEHWPMWAQLAYDLSFVCSNGDERPVHIDWPKVLDVRSVACERIVVKLFDLANAEETVNQSCASSEDDVSGETGLGTPPNALSAAEVLGAGDFFGHRAFGHGTLTVRLGLEIGAAFEQYMTAYQECIPDVDGCDTDYNIREKLYPIQHTVEAYEHLIQQLSVLRSAFLTTCRRREVAMVSWSERGLQTATFYGRIAGGDFADSVRNAFAEASWPPEVRLSRLTSGLQKAHDGSASKGDVNGGAPRKPSSVATMRFWVLNLNLVDKLYRAVAVAPWNVRQAARLVDEAIGLSKRDEQHCLPLGDLRKVKVCELLLGKQNASVLPLVLERLQPVFELREEYAGCRYNEHSAEWLTQSIVAGNICGQTSLGLLRAGEGEYWEVARHWARTARSVESGVSMLYVAARNGDREACTALAHMWARQEMRTQLQQQQDQTVTPGAIAFDYAQLVALFKTAVTSQNANAVLNLGVLWKCGVANVLAPNREVALDCFLMALQGACVDDTRHVAAVHLAHCYTEVGDRDYELSSLLTRLTHWTTGDAHNSMAVQHSSKHDPIAQ